jgi:ABC-2 type transport system ATP-binding protein
MIEIKNISKSYKKVKALDNVSVKITEGEIFLLLGPNGAGKTTLLKLLLELIFPDSGSIVINRDIKIGYMQEEKFGKSEWKVDQILRCVGELGNIPVDELNKRIEEVLEKCQLLKKRKAKIKELSKGLRQRVKWAQTVLLNPPLLILDEPTSGLDPIGKVEIREWIKEEKEKGKTIIISTHLLDEMEKIGTYFSILVNGKLVDEGKVDKLVSKDLETYFYNIVKKERKNECDT